MLKALELQIAEPIFSTYHTQGSSGALLHNNPSIRNWYLNKAINLTCNRMFLNGYTTPNINIVNSETFDNPYIEKVFLSLHVLGKSVHDIIPAFIQNGYYLIIWGVDDYYIDGKSWYKERHFAHDCLLCGYDHNDKTYSLFAYDKAWNYRVFRTPQKSFEEGRKSGLELTGSAYVCAIKAKQDYVVIDPKQILNGVCEYTRSTFDKNPTYINEIVYGTAVQDYMVIYLSMLYDGRIPHDKMDWRIFRLLWEHKKVMLERITQVESSLGMKSTFSEEYKSIVEISNHLRMLYASYYYKERPELLLTIKKQLKYVLNKESEILQLFCAKLAKHF